MNGNQIIIRVSEHDYWPNIKALLTSSIQVNINTCHPSCLTCTDSTKDSCLTCSPQANLQNGRCICKDSAQLFQNGLCVPVCDNINQYHQKQSIDQICVYIQNCIQWDIINQKCLKFQNLMFVQLDQCVKSCSAGFQSVLNPKTQLPECLFIDRFLNVNFFLMAFHSNNFSGIEVDNIKGLSSQSFVTQYQQQNSIVSKCGEQQFYGGFFVNNYNSLITYKFQANGFNFVKIYFKYILIDFPNNIDTQIQVTLNDQKQNILLTQSQLSQALDICGFEGTEVIGTFTLNATSNTQNNLTILNLNTQAYLGIREVSVYAFNCLQDNCLSCTLNNSQTTCQTCDTGYYLQMGVCNKCNLICYSCQDSSSCTQCLPIQGLALNQSNQCVCQEYYYFDFVNMACSACQNNKCLTCQESDSTQCLSCKPPLALLNTDCVESCGTGMAVNQTSNKCQKCIPNCMNCDNNLQSCNKCQNGFFFLNDQCITNCPDGYFGDVQNAICQNCNQYSPNCVLCNSQKCLKCSQGYYLYNSKCSIQCPPKTYFYKIKQ